MWSTCILVLFVAIALPQIEAQSPFAPNFFVPIYNHAGFGKLLNLCKGLNSDTTLAARKKRMQNWHKNNFGTITTKTFSSADNKTVILENALQFLEYRDAVVKMTNKVTKPKITNLFGAAIYKKFLERFTTYDAMNDGFEITIALSNAIDLIPMDNSSITQSKLMGLVPDIFTTAENSKEFKGAILYTYYRNTFSYPFSPSFY